MVLQSASSLVAELWNNSPHIIIWFLLWYFLHKSCPISWNHQVLRRGHSRIKSPFASRPGLLWTDYVHDVKQHISVSPTNLPMYHKKGKCKGKRSVVHTGSTKNHNLCSVACLFLNFYHNLMMWGCCCHVTVEISRWTLVRPSHCMQMGISQYKCG